MAMLGIAAVAIPALLSQAAAQDSPYGPGTEPSVALPPGHATRRIEINPRPLLYRRCVDWYELQNRPSGTVLFPEKRCWWVRG
jgi:hypothetical protein